MANHTQILYQLVFSTKHRKRTLIKQDRRILYEYLYGVLQKRKCHTYRINGVEDHTHFVFSLHPTIALSDLVKSLKHAGTFIIKQEKLFPLFNGWQEGYGAFTYAIEAKSNLINYVKRQEKHHNKETFIKEYKRILTEHEIEFEERFLL